MCLGGDWEVQARCMHGTCVVQATPMPGESAGDSRWQMANGWAQSAPKPGESGVMGCPRADAGPVTKSL
jgi:hypothetical protein